MRLSTYWNPVYISDGATSKPVSSYSTCGSTTSQWRRSSLATSERVFRWSAQAIRFVLQSTWRRGVMVASSTVLTLVRATKAASAASHRSANLDCPPGSASSSPNRSSARPTSTFRSTARFTVGNTCARSTTTTSPEMGSTTGLPSRYPCVHTSAGATPPRSQSESNASGRVAVQLAGSIRSAPASAHISTASNSGHRRGSRHSSSARQYLLLARRTGHEPVA
mmetsp:Transcript_37086/g.80757  ORF Transcript_37086/g.80757 Transcript_37086/m.80757 type:complete len:223 (+) Transcript_37086:271-939(+)